MRKDRHHEAFLGFLHEPKFEARLSIAIAVFGVTAIGRIEHEGEDGVELHVLDHTIIDLDLGKCCRGAGGFVFKARRQIKLPMVKRNGFGIIGYEWRAGFRLGSIHY